MRLDLLLTNPVGMKRLAEAFGEGALKYGDKNWKLGFPESVFISHAIEHLRLHFELDKSDDHLGHATWNLFTLMWIQEHKPELMDLTGEGATAAKEPPVELNQVKKVSHVWEIEEALELIRKIQPKIMAAGYYLALGGGVVNKGWSDNDLDLVAVPRSENSDIRGLTQAISHSGFYPKGVCEVPNASVHSYDYLGKRVDFAVPKVS